MSSLAESRCTACRSDSPPMAADAARALLAELPGWRIAAEDGVDRLVARFAFKDFAAALDFACRVGRLAEDAGHHPRLIVEWGAATVNWWTHAIGGLHRNDFIMAARTLDAVETA